MRTEVSHHIQRFLENAIFLIRPAGTRRVLIEAGETAHGGKSQSWDGWWTFGLNCAQVHIAHSKKRPLM